MITTLSFVAIGLLALFCVYLLIRIGLKLVKIVSILMLVLLAVAAAAYFFYFR